MATKQNSIIKYLDSKLIVLPVTHPMIDYQVYPLLNNDEKTRMELILGGIQWVIHCKFPNVPFHTKWTIAKEWFENKRKEHGN